MRIKLFFTRSRFFKEKTKKRLLVMFLLVVIAHIYANLGADILKRATKTETVTITIRKEVMGDNGVKTEVKPQTIPNGSSVQAGEWEQSLSVEEQIRKTFPEDPETAIAVAKCESRLDNSRIGDTHLPEPSYGLFQINRHWNPQFSVEELQTLEGNLHAGREIYEEGGWNRWSCYRFDYYKKFI